MTQRTPEQQHKQQVRRQIVLPMAGVILALAAILLFVILLLSGRQFNAVSNFTLVFIFLLPTMLLCLIPTFVLLALALWSIFYAGRAAAPLGRGRTAVIGALEGARKQIPLIAAPVIALQSRLAYWEHIVTGGQKPAPSEEEHPYGE